MQTKERARGGGSLVMQVGESLRRAITTGKYRPGERLPSEIELTETHGVSRTVVREAVAALRSDGLVEVRQGAGIFVVVPEAAGVSAGGQATNEHGEKLGPSGKPAVHEADMSSKKGAKDAARNAGQAKPVQHPSPRQGKPHFHPSDAKGKKK